jgi:hypothetical protein
MIYQLRNWFFVTLDRYGEGNKSEDSCNTDVYMPEKTSCRNNQHTLKVGSLRGRLKRVFYIDIAINEACGGRHAQVR